MPTKVCLVKAMVFPVVMYGCESWTIKNAESRRIDAFELCCWRRLLRVCWTIRRSNQSILKEISPGCSWEGLMLKLKFQYFGYLMQRTDYLKRPWCWERFKAGGKEDDRGWDGWMPSPTRWTWVWVNSRSWWWTGKPCMLQSMGSQRVRHDWIDRLSINNSFPWWLRWQRICLQGRDLDSIPESGGGSPGEENDYFFQYSCLGNPMNRGAWQATVHGLQSRTGLSD